MSSFMNYCKKYFFTLFILLFITSSAVGATTLSIGDGSALPNNTDVVPIMINDVTDAGAIQLILVYDPTVVQAINVINSVGSHNKLTKIL